MSKFIPKLVVATSVMGLAAGGLLLASTAAYAQGSSVSPVIVTAPHKLTHDATGEMVSMSTAVRVSDLNLKTPQGAKELDKRVFEAARKMCQELDSLYPGGTPDAGTCAIDAEKGAAAQVKAAKAQG